MVSVCPSPSQTSSPLDFADGLRWNQRMQMLLAYRRAKATAADAVMSCRMFHHPHTDTRAPSPPPFWNVIERVEGVLVPWRYSDKRRRRIHARRSGTHRKKEREGNSNASPRHVPASLKSLSPSEPIAHHSFSLLFRCARLCYYLYLPSQTAATFPPPSITKDLSLVFIATQSLEKSIWFC